MVSMNCLNDLLQEYVTLMRMLETKDQVLSDWMAQEYQGKGFTDDRFIILTNRQERVRSKSEKILADFFDSAGLAYKYECPLRIDDHITLHPDFTFLDPTRSFEIYWEHNGRMDDPDYAVKAYQRLKLYEKHGIFHGHRLITTYESSRDNLDLQWVKLLIRKHLLP